MKIIAVADLHGHLPEIPECDTLLIAGDICPVRDHSVTRQAHWLDTEFRAWLDRVPAENVLACAGNHDFIFQKAPHLVPDLPWTYLQDEGVEIDGIKFWGTPWVPVFGNWAFNADEATRERQFGLIPDDTEVLICHCPPFGYGDLVPRKITAENEHEWPAPENAGCPYLREKVHALKKLRLAVFGHIHAGRGNYHRGLATLANVALVNERYQLTHKPVEFNLGPRCPKCRGEIYECCAGNKKLCEICDPFCPGCSDWPGYGPGEEPDVDERDESEEDE